MQLITGRLWLSGLQGLLGTREATSVVSHLVASGFKIKISYPEAPTASVPSAS